MVAVWVEVVVLVVMNEPIVLPVPVLPRPIVVLLFVHESTPDRVVLKVKGPAFMAVHIGTDEGTMTTGKGFTVNNLDVVDVPHSFVTLKETL